MAKKSKPVLFAPQVFNLNKPAGPTSFDIVRDFKRKLPMGCGKIGHFGTLDPFASGVLLIGVAGAARLNELIHAHLPKTYLAVGVVGVETDTGDHTGHIKQEDTSAYLPETIARFDIPFIESLLREKFLGEYWQAPHVYSAAKFMGRPLHEWARSGTVINKEKVQKHVHALEVVSWEYPILKVRVTVSSGTYVRTLFNEMCHVLGTVGHLKELIRESIGPFHIDQGLNLLNTPLNADELMQLGTPVAQALPFIRHTLDETQKNLFKNGGFLTGLKLPGEHAWMQDAEGNLLGLARLQEESWRPQINFSNLETGL